MKRHSFDRQLGVDFQRLAEQSPVVKMLSRRHAQIRVLRHTGFDFHRCVSAGQHLVRSLQISVGTEPGKLQLLDLDFSNAAIGDDCRESGIVTGHEHRVFRIKHH